MKYVLVVDDDPLIRKTFNYMLAINHQLKVVEAENGKKALEQIAKEVPSVIITDVQMPEMNGLELVLHVRKNYDRIPIIIGSGSWTPEEQLKAMQSDVTTIYEKGALSAKKVCEIAANCLNPDYLF